MKRSSWARKISAAVLAGFIAVSGAVVTAAAAGATPDGMIDEVYDFKYIHDNYSDDSENTTSQKDSEVLKKIAKAIRNYEEEIDLTSYHLSFTEGNALLIMVQSVYPELFFFDIEKTTADYDQYSSDYTIYRYYPSYRYYKTVNGKSVPDKDRMNEELNEFYAEADYYLNLVRSKLSACKDDFSKAALLHDEMVLDVSYDDSHRDNFRFMTQKDGLCANYSEVYAYLLGQLGIKSELIVTPSASKGGMQHEWIKVKLDGKYYNVDATWNDPSPERKGIVYHTFFLLSDSKIGNMSNQNDNHYGYKSLNSASDTRYDTKKYHDYTSKLCKLDPDATVVYAVNNEEDGKKIVSYDYVTDTEKRIVDLSGKNWNIDSSSYYRNMTQTGLDSYDGYLFYNDATNIYRYDPATKKSVSVKKADSGKQFFGVRIRNKILYAQSGTTDPANTSSLKIGSIKNYLPQAEPITLNKTAVTLGKAETLTLKAAVDDSLTDKTVTWTTSNSSVATVSSGKVTAKGTGTAVITAKDVNGTTAKCTVTVKAPAAGITLNASSKTLTKGSTFKLISSVTEGASYHRTFTTSDSTIVKIVSTTDGTCTVKGLKTGTAAVTVKTYNGKTASCKIKVTSGSSTVTLNKTSLTMGTNDTFQFVGTVTGDPSALTFTSSNSNILKITSASSSTCTVKALKAGTATLTAKTSSGSTASCTVTVKTAATSISLNKTSLTLGVGETFKFISSANGYTGNRQFTTSNSSVLKIKETTSGTCTVKALKTGTATIKVKTANGLTASASVTVKAAAAGISLDKTSVTLNVGDTKKLISSVTSGASYQRTFTSSDSSVAKIITTTTGTCTIKAVKAGTATITVKTYNGKTASCKVTVKSNTTLTTAQKRFNNLAKLVLSKYDFISDSGDYVMGETDYTNDGYVYRVISYDKSTRIIMISSVIKVNGSAAITTVMNLKYSDLSNCKVNIKRDDQDGDSHDTSYYSTTTLNPSTFTNSTSLTYTVSSVIKTDSFLKSVASQCDSCINITINGGKELVVDNGGNVSDLGFPKYN